jgi:hypothetical protein
MNQADPNAPTFGLPPCLFVPIAAASVADIEQFVGAVEQTRKSRKGEITAMLVRPHVRGRPANTTAPLWREPNAVVYSQQLFPELQVWVHVDYARYRNAYIKFGMPPLEDGQALDHVQNRKALRLRWCSHPYLRLMSGFALSQFRRRPPDRRGRHGESAPGSRPHRCAKGRGI